jgi:hypothetical protein
MHRVLPVGGGLCADVDEPEPDDRAGSAAKSRLGRYDGLADPVGMIMVSTTVGAQSDPALELQRAGRGCHPETAMAA